eukprot:11316715-Karenia_brevis.AAC.1
MESKAFLLPFLCRSTHPELRDVSAVKDASSSVPFGAMDANECSAGIVLSAPPRPLMYAMTAEIPKVTLGNVQ